MKLRIALEGRTRLKVMVVGVVVLAAAPLAAASDSVIRLPSFAVHARCSILKTGKVVHEYAPGDASVSCPVIADEDAVLSCNGAGLEPLDVHVREVCGAGHIPLQNGTSVNVDVGESTELSVEWLAIDAQQHVQVLASRRQTVSRELVLPIAVSERRLLRFSRPTSSPVTVPSNVLATATPWRIPAARPGGELLLLIPRGIVLPAEFRIAGSSTIEVARDSGDVFAVQGLPSGTYDLLPIYEGGAEGERLRFSIAAERSLTMKWKLEAVGGALISVDVETCSGALGMSLLRRRPTTDGSILHDRVASTTELRQCEWPLDGITPGLYSVTLKLSSGTIGGDLFEVPEQQVARVALGPPGVFVAGEVKRNGRPVSGATIAFKRKESAGTTTAETDTQGHYSVALDRAGEYMLLLHHRDLKARTRNMDLHEGDNPVDWEMTSSTSLTVRHKASPALEPIHVEVRSAPSTDFWSTKTISGDEREATWDDLPYGVYEVLARQERSASRRITVRIDQAHPVVTVDLKLLDSTSTLILRDDTGRPIQGARFPMVVPAPEEKEPGVYSLAGIPAGMPLRIRLPGALVPVCRLIPSSGTLDVTVETGRKVLLRADPSQRVLLNELDTVFSIQNSDCPVLLADFHITRAPGEGEPGLLIQNYPVQMELSLIGPGGTRRLLSDGSGAVWVQH